MKGLWDELNSLKVHERYSGLRGQILLMDPFPNATKIYQLVRQEEKQQEIQSSSPSINAPETATLSVNPLPVNNGEVKAMVSFSDHGNSASSNRDSQFNRPSNKVNNNNQRSNIGDNRRIAKENMHYDYCGFDNHTKDTCYKLHGYPNNRSRKNQGNFGSSHTYSRSRRSNERLSISSPLITQEQYDRILAMLPSGSINSQANLAGIALTVPSNSWIIDIGATSHMCSSLALFSFYTPLTDSYYVQLSNGFQSQVTHIGNVNFTPHFQLEHVYYIPSFKFNLLSVSQLTKTHSYSVTFFHDRCVFSGPVREEDDWSG